MRRGKIKGAGASLLGMTYVRLCSSPPSFAKSSQTHTRSCRYHRRHLSTSGAHLNKGAIIHRASRQVDDLQGQITYRVGICRPPATSVYDTIVIFRAVADLGQNGWKLSSVWVGCRRLP